MHSKHGANPTAADVIVLIEQLNGEEMNRLAQEIASASTLLCEKCWCLPFDLVALTTSGYRSQPPFWDDIIYRDLAETEVELGNGAKCLSYQSQSTCNIQVNRASRPKERADSLKLGDFASESPLEAYQPALPIHRTSSEKASAKRQCVRKELKAKLTPLEYFVARMDDLMLHTENTYLNLLDQHNKHISSLAQIANATMYDDQRKYFEALRGFQPVGRPTRKIKDAVDEALDLIAQGRTRKQIAKHQGISLDVLNQRLHRRKVKPQSPIGETFYGPSRDSGGEA